MTSSTHLQSDGLHLYVCMKRFLGNRTSAGLQRDCAANGRVTLRQICPLSVEDQRPSLQSLPCLYHMPACSREDLKRPRHPTEFGILKPEVFQVKYLS